MFGEAFDLFQVDFVRVSIDVSDVELFLLSPVGGESQGDVEVSESSGLLFEIVFEGVLDGVKFGLSVGHW